MKTLRRCAHPLMYSERGCEYPKGHEGGCSGDWRLLPMYIKGRLRRVLFVLIHGKPDWLAREGWHKDRYGMWTTAMRRS